MTDKYQAIRDALAAGPTPGPWVIIRTGYTGGNQAPFVEIGAGEYPELNRIIFVSGSLTQPVDADAKLIVACDPETIRDLLAERDALRAALRPLAELDLRGDGFVHRADTQIVYQREKSKITVGDVHRAAELLKGDTYD